LITVFPLANAFIPDKTNAMIDEMSIFDFFRLPGFANENDYTVSTIEFRWFTPSIFLSPGRNFS
jgi:hypothetical protein